MSHEIMNNEAFVSVGKPAWHKLGKIVDKAMTTEEALRYGKLDYQVKQSPVEYVDDLGIKHTMSDRVVNYNGDNGDYFGIVSKDYKLVQNNEAIKFFDTIVGEGEAIFETAGALKKGQIAFVTAKLPDYIRVEGTNDVTERYLLLSIGHDGKHATQAMFTPIRVVCNNTLSAALGSSKGKVTIYHRGDVKSQIEQAHKVLGMTNQLTQELSEIHTLMAKTKIEDKEALRIINRQFLSAEDIIKLNKGMKPTDALSTRRLNTLKGVKQFFYDGIGQDMDTCKGTVYGMYNAVNGYLSNKKNKDTDKKVSSLYFGQNAKIIENTFNQAVSLVS